MSIVNKIQGKKEQQGFERPFDLSEDQIFLLAAQCAATAANIKLKCDSGKISSQTLFKRLIELTTTHRVELPHKKQTHEIVNRLLSASWWRARLRKRLRELEMVAIKTGKVCKRIGAPYISHQGLERYRKNQLRLNTIIQSLEAVNVTTGESIDMVDVVENSLANPANRRKALMSVIRGIEKYAETTEKSALFLTLTCPSRMHSRHQNGEANVKFDGTSPRAAHGYLNSVWKKAKRSISHKNIEFFGLRTVEPHHDGCPHWHLLVFLNKRDHEEFLSIFKAYALRDSPLELGAQEHRFNAKQIDPSKGSAVGYISKYVSKSLDGFGLDSKNQTSAALNAERTVAWARTWGIRQFQFFGLPRLGPARELYRVADLKSNSEALMQAHEFIRKNDFGNWLKTLDMYQLNFSFVQVLNDEPKYAGEFSYRKIGLIVCASDCLAPIRLITRDSKWRIQKKCETSKQPLSPPWTRFNNCAGVDFIEVFPTQMQKEKQIYSDPARTPKGFEPSEFNAAKREHFKSDFGGANAAAP